jgi:hypothetical protein
MTDPLWLTLDGTGDQADGQSLVDKKEEDHHREGEEHAGRHDRTVVGGLPAGAASPASWKDSQAVRRIGSPTSPAITVSTGTSSSTGSSRSSNSRRYERGGRAGGGVVARVGRIQLIRYPIAARIAASMLATASSTVWSPCSSRCTSLMKVRSPSTWPHQAAAGYDRLCSTSCTPKVL